MGAFAHFTGLAKSMIMASSRVLAMEWAWRIRMHKGNPIPNYAAMTDENWKQFDVELKKALVKDLEPQDMKVEVTNAEMFAQYGHLAHAVVETSAKVVPKKKKAVKINGNRVSEKTLGLHKELVILPQGEKLRSRTGKRGTGSWRKLRVTTINSGWKDGSRKSKNQTGWETQKLSMMR